MATSETFSERFLSVKIADIGIAAYVVLSVVFDDGTPAVQFARLLLVATAATELTVKPFTGATILYWQALFVAFAWASVLWAGSPDNAAGMASTILVNAICLVVIAYLVKGDPKRLYLFLTCLTVAPVFLMLRIASTSGLLVFFGSRSTEATSANVVGMVAALGFCFAYLGFSRKLFLPPRVCIIFMLLNGAVTILSASRKALIMVGIAMLLFAFLDRQIEPAGRILKPLGACAGVFVGYRMIMDIDALYLLVGNRIETMINGILGEGEVDSSTSTRLNLIDRGLPWIQDAPWFGHGGDNFRVLMETFYPQVSALYSHNNYVELLVGYGIIGFVLFYWIYFVIFASALSRLRLLNPLQTMMFCLMIAVVVLEYGFVDYFSRVFMAFVTVAWVAICTDTIRTGTVRTRTASDVRSIRS